MTDHAEEQEMEAEALEAIFDTHFSILGPAKWQVQIYPEMTADEEELNELNHVAIKLIVTLPPNYPEALPDLDCEIIKGLVEEQRQELLGLAREEAAANEGVPSIFAIAERLREWLAENNQKGLDDLSMHAQMLRKQQAKEKEVSWDFTVARHSMQIDFQTWWYLSSPRDAPLDNFGLLEYTCMVKIPFSNGVVMDRRQGGSMALTLLRNCGIITRQHFVCV